MTNVTMGEGRQPLHDSERFAVHLPRVRFEAPAKQRVLCSNLQHAVAAGAFSMLASVRLGRNAPSKVRKSAPLICPLACLYRRMP
jgi:hypothetical protein